MFTVKDGFKFGIGLTLGYILVDSLNKSLGKKFSPYIYEWTDGMKKEQ